MIDVDALLTNKDRQKTEAQEAAKEKLHLLGSVINATEKEIEKLRALRDEQALIVTAAAAVVREKAASLQIAHEDYNNAEFDRAVTDNRLINLHSVLTEKKRELEKALAEL